MKKTPKLRTFGAAILVGLLGVGVIQLIAGQGSRFSERWITLVGVAIIGATLAGYHFFDGRRPVPTRVRLEYSLLCAAVSGVIALLCFVVISRTWARAGLAADQSGFFYQLTHPWVFSELGRSIGQYPTHASTSWGEMISMGVFCGFAVCYYGFRHIDEA